MTYEINIKNQRDSLLYLLRMTRVMKRHSERSEESQLHIMYYELKPTP